MVVVWCYSKIPKAWVIRRNKKIVTSYVSARGHTVFVTKYDLCPLSNVRMHNSYKKYWHVSMIDDIATSSPP